MNFLLKWIIYALSIMLIAWIVPGISVSAFWSAMLAVIMLSLINIFVRPLAEFISFPVNFLTLGLFGFVLNALLFMLTAKITPGVNIDGFWSALFGALLLSIFSSIIENSAFNYRK